MIIRSKKSISTLNNARSFRTITPRSTKVTSIIHTKSKRIVKWFQWLTPPPGAC